MGEYTTNRYKLISKIGEGVHGVVLRAIDLTNNKEVAIKKISLRSKYGEIALTAIREIKVLQHCNHKNVSVVSVALNIKYISTINLHYTL